MIDIDLEHPEYLALKHVWRRYRDLYIGGETLKIHAQEYLVPRQREPGDVYTERLSRVFYENYIGSIVDWYSATLFRTEPVVTFEGTNARGKEFFAALMDEVDLKGTGLNDFFRAQFVESLITGSSYVLVDFPRTSSKAGNRAEEDATGASRAYLVAYAAEDVINWNLDEQGNFDWVVIRQKLIRKDRVEDPEWTKETRWSYYDKQTFRIYSRVDDEVRLLDEGTHALAKLNRVPLFDLRIPEGLWMLNRAGLLQLEHFNKSNALSWALTMGLFAMPVVYSDRDWNQMVGESYYIQLAPDDKFGWTEPEGKVFSIAQDNLQRLQEEIYRVCYLAQAGGSLDAGGVQSGVSKQLDFSITQEVLRAYGDAMKDLIRRVLTSIEAAREDGIAIGVTGMDEFDITDFGTELSDAKELLGLGVSSATLKKEIFKKLALKYLSDSRQDVKDRIVEEIEGELNGMGEDENDIRSVVKSVMQEFMGSQAELTEERKRRESLEQRVNELVSENQKARMAAEAADRSSAIRTELQKLGVAKVELAYRAVKDDVYRSEDGRLMAQGGAEIREYLTQFVNDNPELLPARMSGGSGASGGQRGSGTGGGGVDLDMIRPGMSPEERERVRLEIARVASQTLRGL